MDKDFRAADSLGDSLAVLGQHPLVVVNLRDAACELVSDDDDFGVCASNKGSISEGEPTLYFSRASGVSFAPATQPKSLLKGGKYWPEFETDIRAKTRHLFAGGG